MTKRPRMLMVYLLLTALLGGCGTQPSQKTLFYRLDVPVPSVGKTTGEPKAADVQPFIGVGPVTLANYLDRPQIITRVNPYRLELDDFHHWAGRLQDNITQLLADSLQTKLGQEKVVAYPWHRSVKPRYELTLDIHRLDEEAGQVALQARWTLVEPEQDRLLDLQQVWISEPVEGAGMEALVAAASRALQQLAEQLAGRLRSYR